MQDFLVRGLRPAHGFNARRFVPAVGGWVSRFAEHTDPAPLPRLPRGAGRPASAPLAALAGGALARRFCAWKGASGERYMCSVFALGACPLFWDAVVLAVRSLPCGGREIVAAADTGSRPEVLLEEPLLGFAGARGASEWHVHLLCESAAARQAAIADLLAAQGAG